MPAKNRRRVNTIVELKPQDPPTETVHIGDFFVAGLIHGDVKQHELPQFLQLHGKTPLSLVHEADNQHDSEAVSVWLAGRRLGYLPSYKNQWNRDRNTAFNNTVLQLERNGFGLRAEVYNFAPTNPTSSQLLCRLYARELPPAGVSGRAINSI